MYTTFRALLMSFLLFLLMISASPSAVHGNAPPPSQVLAKTMHKPDHCDKPSKAGHVLSLWYVGRLENGTIVDTNEHQFGPGKVFEIQLGLGQVAGWDEHLVGMCVDEVRLLIVPPKPELANTQHPVHVPYDVPLHYEVTLKGLREGPPPPNLFREMDENDDGFITRYEVRRYLDQKISTQRIEIERYRAYADTQEKHLKSMLKNQHDQIEQFFKSDDTNKDGVITHDEFNGPKHDEF